MGALSHIWRLARAAKVLALLAGSLPSDLQRRIPFWLRPFTRQPKKTSSTSLATALTGLGPTYIKLGQFLAVRPDIVGVDMARDLAQLHDKVPPFSQKEAEAEIKNNFNVEINELFSEFGEAIAAASIAQVHQARDLEGRLVAVKILRPGIKKKFLRDLESFFWLADKVEAHRPAVGRLRAAAALENLKTTTLREMDLRMEAAAMSEMIKNSVDMDGLYIPRPDWQHTSAQILTTEWVEGAAIDDIEALRKAGHNLSELAARLLTIFLTHALDHGFFHADFHPGNLFVRADGTITLVDFGIMGRLEQKDRHAMAWILHGMTSGDYLLAAREHIYVGYVPKQTDASVFAQALRAIGEPILDKTAQDISMSGLLWQLFETAERFEMRTQPQLLLLQKTMVGAEGLARRLDPQLNIWETAAPVIENWQRREYAPPEMARQMAHTAQRFWRLAPEWLDEAERTMGTRNAPENDFENQSALPAQTRARNGKKSSLRVMIVAFLIGALTSALGLKLFLSWPVY